MGFTMKPALSLKYCFSVKLSGHIPHNKQIEFEQTFRFASIRISHACSEYAVSKDVLKEDVYYFTSYWPQLAELEVYVQSGSFLMISGLSKLWMKYLKTR